MSDQAFFTNYVGTDRNSDALAKLSAALGDCRKSTVVLIDDTDSPYLVDRQTDIIYVNASAGAVTIELPPAPEDGDTYEVVAQDVSNAVTVDRQGNSINQVGANDTITVAFTDVKKYTWVAGDNTWFRR